MLEDTFESVLYQPLPYMKRILTTCILFFLHHSLCVAQNVTLLGTLKVSNGSAGVKLLNHFNDSLQKRGMNPVTDLHTSAVGEFQIGFVEYVASSPTTPEAIVKDLVTLGYEPATAAEAASVSVVPFANNRTVVVLGTTLPRINDSLTKIGFSYPTESLGDELSIQFKLMRFTDDGWSGKFIVPVIIKLKGKTV